MSGHFGQLKSTPVDAHWLNFLGLAAAATLQFPAPYRTLGCGHRNAILHPTPDHHRERRQAHGPEGTHPGAFSGFPKPGILFYDISTLLRDADAWQVAMGRMAKAVRAYQPDLLAGIESRGFLIAAPLALKLGCGFIMLRKRNKLPGGDGGT